MTSVVQMDGMQPLLLPLSRHSSPALTSLVLSTRCAAEKLSVWGVDFPEDWSLTEALQNAQQGAMPDFQHVLSLCCDAGSEIAYMSSSVCCQ